MRENNGVVEYKGSLYLFGGYNGSQWLNDFHEFNLMTRIWRTVEPKGLPPASRFGYVSFRGFISSICLRNKHVISAISRKLKPSEGYTTQYTYMRPHAHKRSCAPTHARTYARTHTYTHAYAFPLTHILMAASRYVSVVHKNRFVLFGGYDGTTWLNDMHEYNFDTKMWAPVTATGQTPSIRSCPSWCKDQNSVYVFGGYDGVQRMNDFFACDLDTYTWSQIPCGGDHVPSPRYFHACAMYNNKMYTFGGYNGTERLNDMYEYNFETFRWSEVHGDSPIEALPKPNGSASVGGGGGGGIGTTDVPSGRSSLVAQV